MVSHNLLLNFMC